MNPDLELLQPYPFERLRELKAGAEPPADLEHIALSIGEPKHPTPPFITEAVISHLHGLSSYPTTIGSPALRESIARWLERRFQLGADGVDPGSQVLPVNGTREALFAFAQAVVDRDRQAHVLLPNPFYQIYEGAALLAGATPWYVNCPEQTGLLPDFESVPEVVWARTQLLYLCSPGNPTGAVIGMARLQALINLAERHDFIIASDECYSELYPDEAQPPVGLLQAARAMGNEQYRRCVVFHSLSKRSNAPGLRSGFVAGDADILQRFLLYRTYHGCAMPPATQAASTLAWQEEEHVRHNREAYRQKFDRVVDILQPHLPVQRPDAGFYLWARTPVSDTRFARDLYHRQSVTVLPGSFLSRPSDTGDPGADHVRMALVAPLEECEEAAQRIVRMLDSL